MELFTNSSREHLTTIAENYVSDIFNGIGNDIEDLAREFSEAGFTKSEFIQILDKNFLEECRWAEEPETNEKVNTETGEGIFWKEYIEDEDRTEKVSPNLNLVPVPDYFRFIAMLDKANARYEKPAKNIITLIEDDYTSVKFQFDTNFDLKKVEW